MSTILTIISEYNPFHFGHQYQLNESVKQTSPDYKVAIMSGNFVQRGEPSIINKWEKTRLALENGFDLIIELPCIYSISSAENFANGAIKIANQIHTTYLSFGSENGNITNLSKLSSLITKNQKKYNQKIKGKISEGYSYPKSQELIINELFGEEFKNICLPNNILGLEYLKSLQQTNSSITPISIKRNTQFLSSSQIRSNIRNQNTINLENLPESTLETLKSNTLQGKLVKSLKYFEKEIIYNLRKMTISDIQNIPDVPENLINKLKRASGSCNNIEELISILKSKNITQARIQRILLYILLNISKEDMEFSKETLPYIRILGTSQKGKKLISSLSQNANIITSIKHFEENCTDKKLLRILEIDKFATDVYTLAYCKDSKANLDYTTKLITK